MRALTANAWTALALVCALGPAAGAAEAPTGVVFRTIARGGGVIPVARARDRLEVIKDSARWRHLWSTLPGVTGPPPRIDFAREMVVGVVLQRGSSGHEVEIVRVEERSNAIAVEFKETTPGRDCGARPTFFELYHLVRLPKSDKRVLFDKTLRQHCPATGRHGVT